MKNEYALVTGAGKRVGSSICKFLALQGYHVIIHYNDSKLEAEKTLKEITKSNGKANLIKADLSSISRCKCRFMCIQSSFNKRFRSCLPCRKWRTSPCCAWC